MLHLHLAPLCTFPSHHLHCALTPGSTADFLANAFALIIAATGWLLIWATAQSCFGRTPLRDAVRAHAEGRWAVSRQAVWITGAFFLLPGHFLWPLGWVVWRVASAVAP